MPIFVTDEVGAATEVNGVYQGAIAQEFVYYGSNLVFEAEQVFTMTTTENLNLETWLTSQGAVTASPIIINVANDQGLFSDNPNLPAFTSGDISGYTEGITINLAGSIHGAGGAAGSKGGDALVNTSTNILTINNTGSIAGGGGGGGNGGNGGGGNDKGSWSNWAYSTSSGNESYWVWSYSSDNNPIMYIGSSRGTAGAKSDGAIYRLNGSYIYEPGSSEGNGRYRIRRATRNAGSAGTGGLGGKGRGGWPAQPVEPGQPGTSGTNRAGNGGQGGSGGLFGKPGETGTTGATGYSYTSHSSAQANNGFIGQAGGAAGYAIDSSEGSIILVGDGFVVGPII